MKNPPRFRPRNRKNQTNRGRAGEQGRGRLKKNKRKPTPPGGADSRYAFGVHIFLRHLAGWP
jgi:hypothetical protein